MKKKNDPLLILTADQATMEAIQAGPIQAVLARGFDRPLQRLTPTSRQIYPTA